MWGELSSECGASCLGASFLWGELSWGELSLGRVVLIPLLGIEGHAKAAGGVDTSVSEEIMRLVTTRIVLR